MATGKGGAGGSVLSVLAAKRCVSRRARCTRARARCDESLTAPPHPHFRSADMPDPRPINSAAWKAEAAQKVFDLLTATEYPQRVSTKLLLGPTAKDFQAILTHMLRCIDGHYIMVRAARRARANCSARRARS